MTLHVGDCLEVMATLDAESIDAIVTDPPYGLEFMGKAWDTFKETGNFPGGGKPSPNREDWRKEHPKEGGFATNGGVPRYVAGRPMQDFHYGWATAALRVAKPGAYLLAFGGTRTVHRMTCAIEDAGWIIRDMLVWGYASGFPKGRANLKPAWEPIVMARKPGPLRMLAIDACRIGTEPVTILRPGDSSRHGIYGNDARVLDDRQESGRWPANVILTDPIFDGGIPGVVGGGFQESTSVPGAWAPRGAFPIDNPTPTIYGDSGTYSRFFLVPKAARSDREPVLDEYAYRLHRERGDCDKLRAWDSAGRSRNEPTASTSPARATSDAAQPPEAADSSSGTSSPGSPSTDQSPTATRSTTGTATNRTTPSPTSPSLTLSPTSASTPGANSETANGGSPAESAASSSLWAPPTGISVPRAGRSTDDADPATFGSSSRASVCGRCGKPLPRVGSHPTVKPVDLMRHLVRLVTPPGGTVLDPFLGSGTTALAAEMEGFAWIGIEREAEYVAIAEARLNGTQKGMAL